jgi:hypothetical protein
MKSSKIIIGPSQTSAFQPYRKPSYEVAGVNDKKDNITNDDSSTTCCAIKDVFKNRRNAFQSIKRLFKRDEGIN